MKTIKNYIDDAYQTHFSQSHNQYPQLNSTQIRKSLTNDEYRKITYISFNPSREVNVDLGTV